ncbi:MAG: DNA polymerase III subunit alpha [Cytophagales bacterium]
MSKSPYFCHLHCHTSYSLLDGAANIDALVQQAKCLGMSALAITDHGNMFGVPKFIKAAKKAGIKPIIGCECYLAHDMHDRKDKRRYHQLLLAKNQKGYENLSRLCSLAYMEGYYYKPRIDKKLIKKYAEGLIATTCCLAAEVPRAILEQGEEAAEKIFLEWVDIFGEDYYIEIQRCGIEEQERCNEVLLRWAQKHKVKVIATNDVHYVKQEDALAQDIMLCLQTGKNFNDPNRMRFSSDQFYLKSPQEMLDNFPECPESIYNTGEVVEKIGDITLERDLMMPKFDIPAGFETQEAYLTHLTFEGGKRRYGILTDNIKERLHYELEVITKTGFAGYFLIVQDITHSARRLGVLVGPGRGSVAGSAVAYALGITDVEPLKYDLLFERFLNECRKSMPDIDIDFDAEGRPIVLKMIIEKYGYGHVAQIITFSTMGAKSSIRDVARVLEMPLHETNQMVKLMPDKIGVTLAEAIATVPELQAYAKNPKSLPGKVLKISQTLEGSQRHTGIHAAGIIIANRPLIEVMPMKTDKNTNLLVTQYDGSMVESVGALKMDILGLVFLSILRDAKALIKAVHGDEIDLDNIPYDDPKTYEPYQQGNTVAIFQFESEGMRNYLQRLHPTTLEHLIAMNALYRPGPLKNIPSYIARMHGKEKIDYMHPSLEKVLKPTFGIPVYQEQIMQMAQIIAGYSLGQADILRRAMGKKKMEEMKRQEAVFVQGAKEKQNLSAQESKAIFSTMSQFAEYGFNRSHSVAYTILSYKTAYLKAHYPAAYMSAVLTHHQKHLDKITFFIEECHRLGLKVQGPDINKSQAQFSSDAEGTIRFGLSAIKGVSQKTVAAIIKEREEKGPFADLFDLVNRLIDPETGKAPIKKSLEIFAMTGVLDNLEAPNRKAYTHNEKSQKSYIEQVLQHCHKKHERGKTRQQTLFSLSNGFKEKQPTPPPCDPYTKTEKLKLEKSLLGFYISGHPLEEFASTLKHCCNAHTQNISDHARKKVAIGGMITQVTRRQNSKGAYFALFTLEDYKGTLDLILFGEVYTKYQHQLVQNQPLYVAGMVKQRYGREGQWELQPESLQPLGKVLQQKTAGLRIKIMPTQVDKAMVDDLASLFQAHAGNHPIELFIPHTATQTTIRATVKQHKVHPSQALFDALDKRDLPYRLVMR